MLYKRIIGGVQNSWVAFQMLNDVTAVADGYRYNLNPPTRENFMTTPDTILHMNPYLKFVPASELNEQTKRFAVHNIESWPEDSFEQICNWDESKITQSSLLLHDMFSAYLED